ncbi:MULTISPECIES: tryptophan halogenase family protein [Sphingomonas]|uniref:tryptophan halogenase family protein n=1 Tax=Sphingomonas TaxID=13687 RepID=UPI000DEF6641|nr:MULTISPECIES: tryptophan halogenase family protein [Sphingomonas]
MQRPDQPTDNQPLERVVIVGGGTAGWLAAAVIAARFPAGSAGAKSVTLIESPDIATIGVGEGTWPTMRATLAAIGIGEAEFLTACDASFKQGSRFDGWRSGAAEDRYLHPFSPPAPLEPSDLVASWRADAPDLSFADAVTAQAELCAHDLAPRQRNMPDYAGAANYGYHLDAAKLAALLRRHATERLGVIHVEDHVEGVEPGPGEAIAAVLTRERGRIAGDLFLDCTGHAALLIGGHHGVGWVDRGDVLFNDRALALQVPVPAGSPIASQTIGTAHEGGWLWDIGLPTRRGIGCVYSSRFLDDARAEAILRDYVARTAPFADLATLAPRRLAFPTGHRERFWVGNCLALGLSAGFIEPLEASAIVLIELSLSALCDNFPAHAAALPIHARRFDALFRERWERIVEFLKLHYLLSERTEPYWLAHRDPASVPPRLHDLATLWRDQPPSRYDLPLAEEMFPAASYQYVYYGLGGTTDLAPGTAARLDPAIRQRARTLAAAMPANRTYLDALRTAASPSQEAHCA